MAAIMKKNVYVNDENIDPNVENSHPNIVRSSSAPTLFSKAEENKRARILPPGQNMAPLAVQADSVTSSTPASVVAAAEVQIAGGILSASSSMAAATMNHATEFGQFVDIEVQNRIMNKIVVDFFDEQPESMRNNP